MYLKKYIYWKGNLATLEEIHDVAAQQSFLKAWYNGTRETGEHFSKACLSQPNRDTCNLLTNRRKSVKVQLKRKM